MLTRLIDVFKLPSNWHRAWTPLLLVAGVIVTLVWMGLLAYGFLALVSWAI